MNYIISEYKMIYLPNTPFSNLNPKPRVHQISGNYSLQHLNWTLSFCSNCIMHTQSPPTSFLFCVTIFVCQNKSWDN